MNKRQKLVQTEFLDREDEVIKQLGSVYERSLADVEEKVRKLTFDIGGLQEQYDWMDADDPERAVVKSMIQSKIYQKQYQEQLKTQIDRILDPIKSKSYLTVSEYLDDCYTTGFVGSIYDMHGQGVPIIAPIDQKALVRAVQLDSKISKGLYTKLGADVDTLKKRITAQVSRSIATGMSFRETAQQLHGQTQIGMNKALRIARTEGHRIQTTAAMDAAETAKSKGADVVKQWDATLDGDTRPSHRRVDGQIRELDEEFSNGLMYPGDPHGKAEEVINCRCALLQRARWALDDDELETLKRRAEYFELDKTEDFKDFKQKYLQSVNNPDPGMAYNKDVVTEAIGTKKDVPLPIADAVSGANPDYGTSWGYDNNCQRCVQAYEFRRRGYNVTAQERPLKKNPVVWGSECFIAPGEDALSAYRFRMTETEVKDILTNSPDGSRHSIFVVWKGKEDNSHVFIAEKVNGVVRYIDPQNGNEDVSHYFALGKVGRFGIFRLDDKEITTDATTIKATVKGVE